MKKNFVFVYLCVDGGYFGPSHGIAYLIPILKKHGFKVSVITLPSEMSDAKFRNIIIKEDPTIVGFSCVTPQFKYLYKYSKAISDIPNLLQIAGGSGPSLSPEEVISQSSIDGVLVGEGEKVLDDFLSRLNLGQDYSATPGFYWNDKGQIKKNPRQTLIHDLSSIAFPDYSHFSKSILHFLKGLEVNLTRGCPFNCSYCSNQALSELYPSKKSWFRVPSVDYSISLLKNLLKQYPNSNNFIFSDELMTANQQWFIEFATRYAEEISLPYSLCIRGESITPEVIAVLKRSKCHTACIGLESGDEQFRKDMTHRNYDTEMFIKRCQMIKDAGIKLFTFNIFGFPNETPESMRKTIELNKIVKADDGACSFFYPFPKTELYNVCQDQDILLSHDEMMEVTNYVSQPCIKLTPEQRAETIKLKRELQRYLQGPFLYTRLTILKYLRIFKIFFDSNISSFMVVYDRFLGKTGLLIKNSNPNLYFSLKKILNR